MQPATFLAVSTVLLVTATTTVPTASAFQPGSNNRVMWENNCDFYGEDRYSMRAGADRCGDICANDGGCTHWTWTNYNGGTCWLKSGNARTKAGADGAACGYVVGRAADASAAQQPSGANGLSADETGYMMYLINDFRRQNGLAPLALNTRLTAAANLHAQDQARRCTTSHVGADGSSFSDRISNQGYNWASVRENVAAGQATVFEAMMSWWNSPGHRANILDPNVKDVGFAKAINTNCGNWPSYWTQDFGRLM